MVRTRISGSANDITVAITFAAMSRAARRVRPLCPPSFSVVVVIGLIVSRVKTPFSPADALIVLSPLFTLDQSYQVDDTTSARAGDRSELFNPLSDDDHFRG